MENHINDLLELGLMSMWWYPSTERHGSCCQQVVRGIGWLWRSFLTLSKATWWAAGKESSKKKGREGYWFWIKRKSATLLTRTHTHKAWQNGKVKEEAVYTFRVLDGIFSLIFRSTFIWLFEASVLGTGPGQHYLLQQWKIQYELPIRYHLLGLGLGNSNYPNVNLRQEPSALWMDEWF